MLNIKRIYQISLIVIIIVATCLIAYANEKSELVSDFCYALQAAMECDDLKMRLDTEGKVEKQVGGKIRGPKSPYNNACMAGLLKAFEDENNGLCSIAWKKYGCSGSKVSRLIQENPFKIRNGVFCEYSPGK